MKNIYAADFQSLINFEIAYWENRSVAKIFFNTYFVYVLFIKWNTLKHPGECLKIIIFLQFF